MKCVITVHSPMGEIVSIPTELDEAAIRMLSKADPMSMWFPISDDPESMAFIRPGLFDQSWVEVVQVDEEEGK